MDRKDKAVSLFNQKFNCCQAVFAAYRPAEALDEQGALKLATVFGGGVLGAGDGLCGTVNGALMAISMRHGRGDVESVEARAKTYELGRRFMAEFKARLGSCICETILGLNIGTPENHAKAVEMKLFETVCVDAVKAASDILEGIL